MTNFMPPFDVTSESLRGVEMFSGLDESQLAEVRRRLRLCRFEAGARLFAEYEPPDAVYFLLNGSVKVAQVDDRGSEIILALLGPGEVVGEIGPVDQMARSATVVARESLDALWLPQDEFCGFLSSIAPLGFALARVLARRVRLGNIRIWALGTLDVRGRVACQIVSLVSEYCGAVDPDRQPTSGYCIPLRLTQSDLGKMVGATRTRVNQVLSPWTKGGILSIDGVSGYMVVHDLTRLRRYADPRFVSGMERINKRSMRLPPAPRYHAENSSSQPPTPEL